jgi:hypothetical protein
MAILEALPRTADAVAVTDVKVVAINGSRFDEMLRRNPEVAVRIIRKYSKRLREANELLEKLVGREVDVEHAALDSTQIARAEKATRHRLVDVSTGTAFFFSNGDETTIGRADPVTGILPDIDLTPVDNNRSVSRRHAKIIRTGSDYHVLEEVGTVNGTYVNDQRIPTGVPVTIHNGDLVKIGQKVRNLRGHGLEEGVSTRLLIYAAQMIAKGISPIDAAEVAIVSPITDDRELQRSIREIVTTII